MTELKIKTTEDIYSDCEEFNRNNLRNYSNKDILKFYNKKYTSNESMIKELNTIIGGHLKSHPEFTISALKSVINELGK